jgi:chloramphenicol 3-O-phosphotransferase
VTPAAVLLTGVYGAGKSSVAAEVAFELQERGEHFALLDLDFLGWAATGRTGRPSEFRLMLANMRAVVANYAAAGVDWYVLAYFIRDGGELAELRTALGVPLRVVRLELPLAEIERRLAADVTTERQGDLREAAASIAIAAGAGIEDLLLRNDRPVQAVAREVLEFLGW